MTAGSVRAHLPIATDEDAIVWPELAEGIQATTPVEAFCNLFTDVIL